MSIYRLFIINKTDTGVDTIQLTPALGSFIYSQKRINVQNRIKLDGTIRFGGKELGGEYDILQGLQNKGKIPFYIEEFNGTTYIKFGWGYLITDAQWDDDKKIVDMSVETFTQYEIYDKNIDTEISTDPQDRDDFGFITRIWDNKFNVKYPYSPVEFDEVERFFSSADPEEALRYNTSSGQSALFNGIIDPIDYAEPAQILNYAPGAIQMVMDFKTVKTIKKLILYADAKYGIPSSLLSLNRSAGNELIVIPDVPATAEGDPAVIWEYEFTDVLTDVKTINLTSLGSPSPRRFRPIEFKIYSNHDELSDSTDIMLGKLVQQGAMSLRMLITNLLGANQTRDNIERIVKNIILHFEGTELFDALVIPSGSLTGDADDYEDMSLSKLNHLLNDIFHKYIRIFQDPFEYSIELDRWVSTNDLAELITIKDLDYKANLGIDLTAYHYDNDGDLINWSKNLTLININNLDKPSFTRYRTESKNDSFKTIDVDSDKSIVDSEMLEIPIDPWAFDIEGLQAIKDDFSGKFILAKCTVSSEATHYTQINNGVSFFTGLSVAEFDLLDGAPWTDSALTSFILTNNSAGFQGCETNAFDLSARDTLRVNVGDSDLEVYFLYGTVYRQITNISGVAEVTMKDARTTQIALIGSAGTYSVDISIDTAIYQVTETDNVTNKDFSIFNLLNKYIAEQPYNTANYGGLVNVDVAKKPDRQIKPLKFPIPLLSEFPDMDQGITTNIGVIQPIGISAQLNGDWPVLEGMYFQDKSFIRETEEGITRGTEEDDIRVTE